MAGGASLSPSPLVITHQTLRCPDGQIAATLIEYSGGHTADLSLNAPTLADLVRKMGYSRRRVIVAKDHYKEVSEGTMGILNDTGPGKPVVIAGETHFLRVLPSGLIVLETPRQRIEYDELSSGDQLAVMSDKPQLTSDNELHSIAGSPQASNVSAPDTTPTLAKASYAGIPCELRSAPMTGKLTCVAWVRGREIVLAEDMQTITGRSWMLAKTTTEVCMSPQDFAAPSNVPVGPSENLRRYSKDLRPPLALSARTRATRHHHHWLAREERIWWCSHVPAQLVWGARPSAARAELPHPSASPRAPRIGCREHAHR